MKLNKNKEIKEIKATRIFTDRTEPRKAFWDKYTYMQENIQDLDDVYILDYYGVGGIGKSTLLRQIQKELIENDPSSYYISYDFQVGQDVYSMLKTLRTNLIEKYKFNFPKFDIALICYAKKIGDKADKEEIKSMVEQSKTLSLILDTVSLVPQLSLATSILKLADSGVSWIRNLADKDYKVEVAKLENQTEEEILKKLPQYFADDMAKNISSLDKPFVFFFDTYEKLVDTIGEESKSHIKDLWLRDDDGLVLNIPNVLWVIAGREKLSWEKYNSEWSSSIESHILGDLGYADADGFLREAGFSDENLRKQLYDLTNGTPVYLDICVNTLEKLLRNDEEVTLDKFGGNTEELLERFIRYMDVQTREVTHLLCLMGVWNDNLINEVASNILPSFSSIIYETIKDASFVIEDEGKYYIHKTVREIINKECPKLLKDNYNKIMYKYFYEYITEKYDVMNVESSIYLDKYLEIFYDTINSDNAEQYMLDFAEVYSEINAKGNKDLAGEHLENCYIYIKEHSLNYTNFHILEYYFADELLRRSKIKEAHELFRKSLRCILDNNIVNINGLNYILNSNEEFDFLPKSLILETFEYVRKLDLSQDIYIDKNTGKIRGNSKEYQKYSLLKHINHQLGYQERYAKELFDEAIENVKEKIEKIYVIMYFMTEIPERDILNEYDRFLNYLNMCESFFLDNTKTAEMSDYTLIDCQAELASVYITDNFYDREKALLWINKAEERLKNTNIDKRNLLISINNKKMAIMAEFSEEESREYCIKQYDYIVNNFDTDNILIQLSLIGLLIGMDYPKFIEYSAELLEKYSNEEDMAKFSLVWGIVGCVEEFATYAYNIILKYENIELNEDNVANLENLLLDGYIHNFEDNERAKKMYLKLCDYYEKKYGAESEKTLVILEEMFVFCAFCKDEECINIAYKILNLCMKIYQMDSFAVYKAYQRIKYAYTIFNKRDKVFAVLREMQAYTYKYFPDDMYKIMNVKVQIINEAIKTSEEDFFILKDKFFEEYSQYFSEHEAEYYEYLERIVADSLHKNTSEKGLRLKLEDELKIYEYLKKTLPPKHNRVINILESIVMCFYYLEDKENTIKYCKILCDIRKNYYDNTYKLKETYNTLGELCIHFNEYEEAFNVYEGLYESCKKMFGVSDSDTIFYASKFAYCCYKLEKYTTALKCLLEVENNAVVDEKNQENYAEILSDIAYCYLKLGDGEKRFAYYNKAYEFKRKIYGMQNNKTVDAGIKVATEYWLKKDYAKYVDILQEMYDECKSCDDKKIISKIKLELVSGYAYTNREEEALKMAKEGYEEMQSIYDDKNNIDYIRSLNSLLIVFTNCGTKEEATIIANEAKALAENNLSKGSNLYQKIMEKCEKISKM